MPPPPISVMREGSRGHEGIAGVVAGAALPVALYITPMMICPPHSFCSIVPASFQDRGRIRDD